MKISYNWLKDYVSFDNSPEEVAETLTLTGLEVESFEQIGSTLEGVITGKVLTCEQHPNADRLKVCTVDVGSDEPLPIVCGAPNVAAGQTVAVAPVGTTLPVTLPDGKLLTIKKSKIRGEVSHGMICAEDELGLGDDHSGIMVLKDDIQPGTPLAEVLDTNVDYVFEIGLTPNRPDASCHLGVARDLAAVLNKHLKKPYKQLTDSKRVAQTSDYIDISIADPDKCPRYVGMLIRGVKIGESPKWLQNRLSAIGLRPINNVVDATNYVLHELGQPLHAFDYNLVAGKRIEIKSFDHETLFTTLDGTERKVPAGGLFICDEVKPVALAGIMGGLNSEINDDTTDVFLESAYFEPVGIRKTSKQLGLQTDSSYRFERGVDPNITFAAANRCAGIIADIAGGKIDPVYVDVNPVKHEPLVLTLRLERLNQILGMEFKANQAVSVLRALEFEVRKNGNDEMTCTVPSFRPDITQEIDLIEEVARIFDYNKIPNPDYIHIPRPEILPFREQFLSRIREISRSLDYREIYTNSLLPVNLATGFSKQEVLIPTLNPISQDTAVLRPSLIPGFLKAVSFNANRGARNMRFFEAGNIFHHGNPGTWHDGIVEQTWLLYGLAGLSREEFWSHKEEAYEFFDIKGSVEILLRSLRIDHLVRARKLSDSELGYYVGEEQIGSVLELSDAAKKQYDISIPTFAAILNLDKMLELAEALPPQTYKPVPRYPGIDFDLALLVDKQVDAGDLEQTICSVSGSKLRSVTTFDVFEGKSIGDNQKSVAFRLRFIDELKTLTIKDVDSIIAKVVKQLERLHNAKLRS